MTQREDLPKEFSVYWWDTSDNQIEEARFIGPQEAVETVKRLASEPSNLVVNRIIITDGDDYCTFEWVKGKGVIFPTRDQCRKPRDE